MTQTTTKSYGRIAETWQQFMVDLLAVGAAVIVLPKESTSTRAAGSPPKG